MSILCLRDRIDTCKDCGKQFRSEWYGRGTHSDAVHVIEGNPKLECEACGGDVEVVGQSNMPLETNRVAVWEEESI